MSGFDIPTAAMNLVEATFSHDAFVQMCREMLCSHLFSRGLAFRRRGTEYVLSPELEDTVKQYWMTFAYDLFDEALKFGFAVVILRKDRLKRIYPSILRNSFYRIRVDVQDYQYVYKVYPRDSGDPLEDAIVYDNFGFVPVEGRLTSVVSRVVPIIQFINQVRKCAIEMEHSRCQPQHFIETREQNIQRQEGIDYDFYAEADNSTNDPNMQFERNKEAVDELRDHQSLYRGNVRAERKLSNLIHLPIGKSLVMAPSNAGRQDFNQVLRICQEEIASTMGTPRGLMIGDRAGNQGSSVQGLEILLRQTIQQWQRKIEFVLTDLYNMIYTKVKVNRKEDIYKLKRRTMVTVHLPILPRIGMDELNTLYDRGVIGWEPYSKYVLQCVNMPAELREMQPPETSEAPEAPPAKKQKV